MEEASVCEHLKNFLLCQGEHVCEPLFHFRDLNNFGKILIVFTAKNLLVNIFV